MRLVTKLVTKMVAASFSWQDPAADESIPQA